MLETPDHVNCPRRDRSSVNAGINLSFNHAHIIELGPCKNCDTMTRPCKEMKGTGKITPITEAVSRTGLGANLRQTPPFTLYSWTSQHVPFHTTSPCVQDHTRPILVATHRIMIVAYDPPELLANTPPPPDYNHAPTGSWYTLSPTQLRAKTSAVIFHPSLSPTSNYSLAPTPASPKFRCYNQDLPLTLLMAAKLISLVSKQPSTPLLTSLPEYNDSQRITANRNASSCPMQSTANATPAVRHLLTANRAQRSHHYPTEHRHRHALVLVSARPCPDSSSNFYRLIYSQLPPTTSSPTAVHRTKLAVHHHAMVLCTKETFSRQSPYCRNQAPSSCRNAEKSAAS